MLTETDHAIWSDIQNHIDNENEVVHDIETRLMTVQIGSGEYVYQAFWI
jgi:hypothetical protein